MANKVRYGLKNAYYAVAGEGTNNAITFGTPKRLPGAVSLTLDANAEQESFYADDIVYYVTSASNGYDGTLELALIPDDFEKECLGTTKDGNGLLVESASDNGKYFALLFEFTGDQKAIRHCVYYCKATRGSVEGETKGESAEVQTEELTFTASPMPNTEVIKSKTSDDTTEAVYNAWYTAVTMPSEETE